MVLARGRALGCVIIGIMLPQVFGLFGLVSIGVLLGACVYESVVMAPNYAVPESLAHIRAFFRARTPAHFFRIVAPLTMVLLVLAIVTSWATLPARWFAIGGLVLLIVADAITFSVHYPRNKILFIEPLSNDRALLARTARQWAQWNMVRIAFLLCAALSVALGIVSISVSL